jgi:hypothetical protein
MIPVEHVTPIVAAFAVVSYWHCYTVTHDRRLIWHGFKALGFGVVSFVVPVLLSVL